MINEVRVSQDIPAFQKDIALDRLSSLVAQQARRNVIIVDDASTDGHAVEKTLKQTPDTFMQNMNKVSNKVFINIKNEKKNIEHGDTGIPAKKHSLYKIPLTTLQDEELIKQKQHGNIITDREATTLLLPNVPTTLNTANKLHRKPVITPSESVELFVNTLPKLENSENIGVQNMQMEVPSIDSFTPLEAAAISCVLEECLDQLAIIGFMLPAKVDSRWDDTFKTIDETYGVPDEPRTIFREDMGLLPIVPTEAEKMQRDRNYTYQVLERVLRDIKNNGKFDSLQKEIDNIAKKQEGDHNLEANAQIRFSQAEELQGLLESEKKENEEDRKKTIRLAQESDAQVDHAIFLNSGKLGYAEKWEKARLEQQELKLHLQRKDMLNKLSDYSKEHNAEQIISAELNAYLEADIKEKEEQVVMWTKKYNEELVERQQEIDELKRLIEEQKLEMEEMRALIDKRQKLIDECIAEEKRLQEEAKLNKAATIIQSIWKGHMVRQQLGKYKNLLKRLRKRKKLSKQKKERLMKRKEKK
ncbi:dynein regulatory complex protein 9-like [Formica exsecta]|uniref:dynein regulatory complex protein 9-like n=1 Tax=Formica exsecta TaxID=72781 RepID=UPI0011428958|nr:dynein regulatory complex protein 9-like [Formica exsecta]